MMAAVTGMPEQASRSPTAAGPDPAHHFVGRHGELEALLAALRRAVDGEPTIALLAGEPGIGKTRTAQAFADQAAQQQVLVLWGRCPEEPGAPPYWPWVQLIRRYAAQHDEAAVAAVMGSAAPQLAALDPRAAPPARADADAAQARFRLFDAIAGFWQRAAARQPLLLVIDDLHQADVPSLKLLEFVLAEAGQSRLMVLATYRDAEVVRQHPLADTLAQVHRHCRVRRLLLGGFSASESVQFVAAAGVASSAVALTLHDQTDGHPLFLAELTRDLLQPRAAPTRRVPMGVREVIGARLNRLTPACSRVLQHAAVIGRAFDFELLVQLLAPMSSPACRDVLVEAQAASLIDEAAEARGDGFQFSHALVRDTLYDEMPPAQRATLHQRVAQALETTHEGNLTPWLSILAHHWHAAGDAGDIAKVIKYATHAARHATARLAHEEAVRHYRLAVAALGTAAAADDQRCALLLAQGDAENSAGDSTAALATFAEAAEGARRLGDVSLLSRAALGFGTAQWRLGIDGTQAARLVREALALSPAGPADTLTPERVRLSSMLCRALLFSNRPAEAEAAFHEAVAMARRLGDPLTLFDALSAIVPGRWYAEGLPLRIRAAREGFEMMRRDPQLAWPVPTIAWHCGDLMESGDTAGALAVAHVHHASGQATKDPFNEAVSLAALTMIATHEGRFAEAEQYAMQCLRCGQRFDRENAAGLLGVQMFTIRRHQGRLQELAPVLGQFLDSQPLASTWRPGLAIVHRELGARDDARRIFEGLAASGFADIPHDAIRTASLAYLAEVCAWLGDRERAPLLLRLLAPCAERNIVFGAHTASLGAAARLLGLLQATLQRWDEAQRHFEFALLLDARSGGRPWLARSRLDFAAMLERRDAPGDREHAQNLVEAALGDACELGLRGLEAQARAMRQGPPVGAAVPQQHTVAHPAGLSRRELQVLRLIAAGKTNAEIAAALHRSPATVAIHVRNILGKTQSANRAEATAFAARHGLLAPP
jgi:DNA-binding CsgD family transcriptional regulator/tetratricopeptide (TPR) repeat protein